jgi:hypothetical protein
MTIQLNKFPNYELLTDSQLNDCYERLARDLSLFIRGGGSVAWKRKVVADRRERINAVLAIILTRQEAEEREATATADHLLNAIFDN